MPIRRSFFADTVEEALAQATRRMGAETLLVGSRRTEPAERHLGTYEVIVEGEGSPSSNPQPQLAVRSEPAKDYRSPSSSHSSGHGGSLDLLRHEISSLQELLARCAVRMAPVLPPELLPVGARLIAADFCPTLVESLLHASARRLAKDGTPIKELELQRELVGEISCRLRVDPNLGIPGGQRKVIAFAGPAGSGKTSTLVKLAVRSGLAQHSPTLIISADTYRVAAADQLRTYSAILGVSCEVVETPIGLVRALEEHRAKETVLVDLPGMGPREPELLRDWASVLDRPEINVHLVLPATMRCADLARTAGRLEPLRPSHLVFTHLDETACYGALLSLAMETGKPVSFLCTGQSVPEDIEPATRPALLRLIGARLLAAATVA
jgi:flagellar biosynthesis protein FlhF